MNILITGMQRSGTTLLRRIFSIHPGVRRVFHESFFLSRYKNKKAMDMFIKSTGINAKKHIWGEKCPYYPNLKKIPVEKYCETLHNWYPDKFKVIHIVRHPIDIANSNVKKFKYVKSVDAPLRMYKKIVPRIVSALIDLPHVMTIKFENLVINPDVVVPEIYEFCGLDPNVNFVKRMRKITNPVYQRIDESKAFQFMNSEQTIKTDFTDVFEMLDQVDGPKY